ncbi:MAG TPA: methylenetetrahydrofolate reductase [NAD(P)H] [Xanthomonadaceae bacterium]|nr:methylenetetrahydrofolate reductase [NAD(P)H] [Xanthomonadaceae bacterium]
MIPISFEFFPPKTDEQRAQLERAVPQLKARAPEYVSVTFGAGGSTLSYTPETVRRLREVHGLDTAPHISCMGGTRSEIAGLLDRYLEMGVERIVALRGDLPSGMAAAGDFRYANELVAFIRERHEAAFAIEVACYPETHPQCRDAQSDLINFQRKVEAGATGAITQYFFNPDAYFRFVEDARGAGIDVPIVPGIMPISNFSQLRRFSELCGAEIPRWIATRMAGYGDDVQSIRAFGADVVAAMCKRLVEGGAPGLHLYTLNRARTTLALLDRLQG